jgi:hypothetical protein
VTDAPRPRPVMVACPCCGGEGWVELTGTYRETLVLLKRQRAEVNGAALAKLCGIKATAMNNRLIYLERLGLAVGRRNGRERLWRARP